MKAMYRKWIDDIINSCFRPMSRGADSITMKEGISSMKGQWKGKAKTQAKIRSVYKYGPCPSFLSLLCRYVRMVRELAAERDGSDGSFINIQPYEQDFGSLEIR